MPAALVNLKPHHLPEVRQIFFETSSRKKFQNEEERERFFEKYVGYYLQHFPKFCLVALEQSRILGYLVASPSTGGKELLSLQPHLEVFKKEFVAFPAHLHMNCHHEARGQGIGRLMMEMIEELLRAESIIGLHIMTSPDSSNKFFYHKLGFDHQVLETFKGTPILLMGKNLSGKSL